MDEAADALAKIYTHWGKEQIKPVDVLDPKSIRENAAHDIQLGLIGMDIGQMLKDGVELTKRVKDRMGENFAEKRVPLGRREQQADRCNAFAVYIAWMSLRMEMYLLR